MKTQLIACGLLVACTPHEENLGFTPAVGAPRWAVALGTSYDDRAMGVAIDSIGDVVAAGDGQGPADQWGSPSDAGFVTKRVASDGSERWTVNMVPQLVDSYAGAMGIAVDAQDNVIVVGSYIGTVDFGGQRLALTEPSPPSHSDTFIAKYSWDGHLLWARGLDPQADSMAYGVAVDSVGRIVVTGMFGYGTLTLGDRSYTVGAKHDGYVATFDPGGSLLWGAGFIGTGDGPAPQAVAIDRNDDVWIAGQFTSPTTFGGATIDPAAQDRGFLVRYRKDGLFLSSQPVGAEGLWESSASQVVVSSAGQIVVQTTEVEAPDVWATAGVHVFDDTAHELWSTTVADNGNISPQPRTLATTATGVIMTSAWDDPPKGAAAMEVVAFDPNGNHSMATFGSRTAPAGRATLARASAVGATGSIAWAGELSGAVDFGSGPVQTHGNGDSDAFIVLVDPPAP